MSGLTWKKSWGRGVQLGIGSRLKRWNSPSAPAVSVWKYVADLKFASVGVHVKYVRGVVDRLPYSLKMYTRPQPSEMPTLGLLAISLIFFTLTKKAHQ